MNVLFVTADQWRAECLSALGHPCLRTPNLDRLAAGGTLFSRHFAQATPCGPSRASIHTGMYAMNHRSVTNGTPLDARHANLAAEARAANYRPTLFGYTDMSADPRGRAPDDPWLRTYEGIYPAFEVALYLPEAQEVWLAHLGRRGRAPTLADVYGGALGEAAPYGPEDSETAFLTDAFLAWLDRIEGEARWFAHLSYIKPHPPFVAAAPWHSLYHQDDVPPPARAATAEREARLHPWLAAKLARPLGASWWGKPASLDEGEIRKARAVYLGLIAELDHHLGRILEALRTRGELERTLIVVTSDHGEMLGDHWLLGKDGFFRQAFHVPLIIRDPSPQAVRGQVVAAFTEHVDLMPTILERIGARVPLQCDGKSLVPWLVGRPPEAWREAAHYEHDFRDVETLTMESTLGVASERCALAVRQSERYAYVHFNGFSSLCFDLEEDPGQLVDIGADPARAAEVLSQAQAMLSWRMDQAERRLTGCKLTESGVIGRYE
jgi:arylsulfatase A-like enzyme